MSLPSSSDDRPNRPDIYTALLAIAVAAVAIACLLLFLEQRDYSAMASPSSVQAVSSPAVSHA